MPVFETITVLTCPVERVWDFLSRPANLVAVSPPELHMRLVDGPEVLTLGARITAQGRRWGISQTITSEVTAFTPPVQFVDEQRQGPFGKFVHTHTLEALPEGTRMTDRIEFEGPGGLLGLVLNAARIREDLERVFEYRAKRFREWLETSSESSSRP
jgi:ligand-binding SRPBCC domain-containing protein